MTDLAAVRAGLPALQSLIYLNNGTAGPLPSPVAQAMRDAIDEDELRGRASGRRFGKIKALLADCRTSLGALVGVTPEQIALTSGTTESVSIVLDRLDLGAGGRIVISSLEHPAILALLERLRRRGIEVATVAISPDDGDAAIIDAFADALRSGARLGLISHVAYGSGRVLPVAGIAAAAREAGAMLLVDGAQAVGAIPVDVTALGADFYAFPGQKWLMAPEGSGALAIRGSAIDLLGDPDQGAAGFERSAAAKPIWAGMRAALAWRRELGGEAVLTTRVASVAAALRAALETVPNVALITPPDMAGIISFRVDGMDGDEALERLSARRILARTISGTDWVRLSAGFFISDAEIEAVGSALTATEAGA